MLLPDGTSVRRTPPRPSETPSETPPAAPTPAGEHDPSRDDVAALLARLTVPEVRGLLDGGTLDPAEVLAAEQAGKQRAGIVGYAGSLLTD